MRCGFSINGSGALILAAWPVMPGIRVSVIAFCHLQREVSVPVKGRGKSLPNNYCRANYQVGNI